MPALDTAVIPCGGLGRRLRPITNWVPKEMLPVGLKPLLYWALDEAAVAGLLRAILVVNPHKPIIEAAARQYQGALELEFVPQPAFRGLGDAILSAEEALAGSPFVLLQPDQLFDGPSPTAAVLASWRQAGKASVACARTGDAHTRVGRVAYPGNVFRDFHAIAAQVAPGAELDNRPVLQRLAERGELVEVETPARFFDIGVPEGYRAAVAHWPAQVP